MKKRERGEAKKRINGEGGGGGRFWHVTDFHYDNTYFTSQLSCNDDVPSPGPYGDYWCDSPWRLVQSTVDFMADKTKELGVDFAIWTGDTVAHISDDDTTLSENIAILRKVTELLENALPGIPVYASLGNHDFYPSDQAETNVSEIYTKVGDMWKDWIKSQSMVERFEDGGFYSVLVPNATSLRVLALNTNLYFTSNDLTAAVADPAGQFAWMEQQLQNARATNEKVMVTGHVPAAPLTRGLVNWFYPAHKTRFVDILTSYHDVIVATHFGHDHQDGFKLIQNTDGNNMDR
ncbi:acid sphingomyelinase-like phosphodiesterase 3b [Elysia marginata]|uniref:Acid sphingomyelinase-like phosphodiesterase 3b n=1 Tax=Elysia marginata TaxID=1093978 RepID=A0AAV4JC75_9GAST|nr:acid sphingomyelinase-like phosphodiesterase 3b [Elysia marginata]